MNVKYNGYNSHYLTMVNGNATQGALVSVDSSGRACIANPGSKLLGICVSVRGELAVIQTHGYMTLKYADKPSYGVDCVCVADGNRINPTTVDIAGRIVIVVEIDEENKTAGFILC